MRFPKTATPKRSIALSQPKVGNPLYELGQLTALTKVQMVDVLGIAYETINRWENGHTQSSLLALKQIQQLVDRPSHSSSEAVRDPSKQLLRYFSEERAGL